MTKLQQTLQESQRRFQSQSQSYSVLREQFENQLQQVDQLKQQAKQDQDLLRSQDRKLKARSEELAESTG